MIPPSRLAVVDPGRQVPDYDRQLCAALAEQGHRVTFITGPRLYGGDGDEVAADRSPSAGGVVQWQAFGRLVGGPLSRRMGVSRRTWLRRSLRAAGYGPEWLGVLRHFSTQSKPATLLVQWSLAPLIDAAAMRTLRQWGHYVVFTVHNVLPHEPRPWHPFLWRQLYQAVDHLVVQSPSSRQRLVGLMAGVDHEGPHVADGRDDAPLHGYKPRISVVAMPADAVTNPPGREEARGALGLPLHAPVALFFGHIRPYKGLEVLLQAWPRVVARLPAAVLVVAGQVAGGDTARREIVHRCRGLFGPMGGIRARGDADGPRPEAPTAEPDAAGAVSLRLGYVPLGLKTSYFAAADVVALPYRGPVESAVLAAARGHGRAVVASRVPGLADTLAHGSGLLVAPEDPHALADALIQVLVDGEEKRRLEAAARTAAQNWTWADAARQYASLAA